MINETNVQRYCCEDISKIENYEAAVNDQMQVWDIHHRAEILPCGTFSQHNLIDNGLYYNRPSNELIFLTHGEHARLHGMNQSEERRKKISKSISAAMMGEKNPFFGKHHSEETREKMSAAMMGHEVTVKTREKMSAAKKGMKYWNNGQINVRARTCPPGFVPGRLKK